MIKIIRTNSYDADFIRLVAALDAELAKLDGDEHAFYAQFNKIDKINHVALAYDDDEVVGCGAIKNLSSEIMEVKRMYVLPTSRNRGIATKILLELEKWAMELSCEKCVLETGRRQPDAIKLYQKNGYRNIANYGQYAGKENSLCFEKRLQF